MKYRRLFMGATDSEVEPNDWMQFLGSLVAAYVLLWIAVFNGYPIVYPDTATYITRSFTLGVPTDRTVYYPIFIRITSFGITPWFVVFAQSVITIFVLLQCLIFLFEHNFNSIWKSRLLLGVVLGLAWGTSLPWYVGQLMPDIFTGLLILCLFLLLYDSQLTIGTSLVLAFLVAVFVSCHLSHVVISSLVLVVIGGFRVCRLTRHFCPARSNKQLLWSVLIPILVGTFAIVLSNRHAGRGWTLSAGGHMFVLGRLVVSGMTAPYLRQECKVEPLIACRYLDSLPSNENVFLWHNNPLFNAMGGWTGSNGEATKIIVGTIRHSPGRFLWECIKQMFRQIVAMKTTIGISGPYPRYLLQTFQTFYPEDIPKCVVSKQWTGGLLKLAHPVSNLNLSVFWCSMVCCVVFFASRHHADAASRLFIFVLVSLFSNALVTASLSMVADRFQSRVSWLMAFCCMAYIVSMLRQREYRSGDDRRSVETLKPADSGQQSQKTTYRDNDD